MTKALPPTFTFGAQIDMSNINFQQYSAVEYTALTTTEIAYTDAAGDTITFTGTNFNAITGAGTVTGSSIVTKSGASVFAGKNLNVPLSQILADEKSNAGLFNDFFGAAGTVIIGSKFNDTLVAGNGGGDTLKGGAGADTLTGGTGNTTFSYTVITDSKVTAPDLITNYHKGDKINLNTVDANTALAGVQHFHLGKTAGHTGDVIVAYNASKKDTVISLYDNATGKADGEILLAGKQTLTTADFVGVTAVPAASTHTFNHAMAAFGAHAASPLTTRLAESHVHGGHLLAAPHTAQA